MINSRALPDARKIGRAPCGSSASHTRQALISHKMRDKDTRRAPQFCYLIWWTKRALQVTDNRRRQIRQFKLNERSVHRHRGESAADQDDGDATPVRAMTDYEISSRRAGGGPTANSPGSGVSADVSPNRSSIKPLAKTVATMEPIVARCAETRDRHAFALGPLLHPILEMRSASPLLCGKFLQLAANKALQPSCSSLWPRFAATRMRRFSSRRPLQA
jgi:hypothetical protein